MATMKTVISTNVPQVKQLGVSIIIDQDQAANSQPDQHHTLTELGNHNNKTKIVEVSTKREMSPNSPAMKKKTFIDINRNNVLVYELQPLNDSQTNAHYIRNGNDNYDRDYNHHERVKETGYSTTVQTFPPSLGERGKLENLEMAKTAATSATTSVDVAANGLLVGKSPTHTSKATKTTKITTVTTNNIDSLHKKEIHNEFIKRSTNGTANINTKEILKKTIIQCNIENSDDHNDVHDELGVSHNDDFNIADDDDESIRICGDAVVDERNDHCQHLCNGLRGVVTQQSGQQNDSDGRTQVSRLTKAEDCASSAVKSKQIFENNADQATHVVKIQIKPKTDQNLIKTDKQVTVVQVNEVNNQINKEEKAIPIIVSKTELSLSLPNHKMVQKPPSSTNSIASGNTTVTELNVSNPSYLYYTMSSGQFSPCDTLDSGTGSDLESNGTSGTPITKQMPKGMRAGKQQDESVSGDSSVAVGNSGCGSGSCNGAPKLELHLKTTKIRINNNDQKQNGEHQRAGSLTDSEESETSFVSCDSLHSSEYVRQLSASPSGKKSPKTPASAFLPDSLLRDIRDRKYPTNDFETKYGNQANLVESSIETVNEKTINEQKIAEEAAEHAKFLQECKQRENHENLKRASITPGKTFIINAENGTFIDTKMNSMPRKYEADKYYNFHVNEHENFHSFGHINSNGNNNSNANVNLNDDEASLAEYDLKSIHDDDFAGYKDIRCNSATSTIRSSKGTVRGVKNRVRNGIATFLQMQQPHVKNYLDKDFGKVVLYTTSMGIIRDTYAKCSNVKQILRTLLVKFEERDVFMSVEYQAEIKDRMHTDIIRVPQLFVEGQHIGDAETVERLNESGELRQLLKPYKSISTTYTCQTCGGYRLLPCPSCNGSKKSVHRNHFKAEFVALKCMNCDEVGLVKCHNC